MPAISVVVPTRDRPEFVRQALSSLGAQEFADFEVIVADNPVTAPCSQVVADFADERFRYMRVDRPLSMNDNWEAGCAAATGDYVGVMIDKTVWLPSTMRRALGILEQTSASVISWWNSNFGPYDEQASLTRGGYHAYQWPPCGPVQFSGRDEVAEATAFKVRRGTEGPAYFRGKICFGLYRRDVVEVIRGRIGRLFPPISPDYTSRVAAFATAPSFVDAGVPLQLSYLSESSSGARVQREPAFAKRFLDEIDAGLVGRLPIPGLYASQHNIVAHDYLLAEKLGVSKLDRVNLTLRAREDLALVEEWTDSKVRGGQYRLLADAERRAGRSRFGICAGRAAVRLRLDVATIHELLYRTLLRLPRLHMVLRILRGKRPVAPTPQPSAVPDTLAGAILAADTQLKGRRQTSGKA